MEDINRLGNTRRDERVQVTYRAIPPKAALNAIARDVDNLTNSCKMGRDVSSPMNRAN